VAFHKVLSVIDVLPLVSLNTRLEDTYSWPWLFSNQGLVCPERLCTPLTHSKISRPPFEVVLRCTLIKYTPTGRGVA
jgi:hypothetical protein